jgi:LysM repeat protein
MEANPTLISEYFILPGMRVRMPDRPPPSLPDVDIMRYVVRPGDTLFSIARTHNVTLTEIYRLNPNIDAATLRVGDIVRLPGGSVPPPPPPAGEVNVYNYVVRPGDTVFSIARANNTTVREIFALNPGLEYRTLRVGDVIRLRGGIVPPPAPAPAEQVSLEPRSGAPGTVVEVSISGYPRFTQLRLLAGTSRDRLREIQILRTDFRGRAIASVRIPSWAANARNFYFATETMDGSRLAVSPSFRIGQPGGPPEITVVGTLTREGAECPTLRGDDGRLYTLTSRDTSPFRPGDRVRVVGRIAEVSFCQQGTTIDVRRLEDVP